ncbi:Linear gramicidin dehydrogenase LgrE [Streptomyces lavendulae subsp. lavendulae]|uniref:Linear gramicidin dehydrogenase LgrE n=1 Tax=Streptomyces lavendulae subsp. lavendulae TaxID=58340 RepID=A0A2K8PAF7_STRLA|nr:alpha/beta fold hydrolase [Streptomyces lavendulae]ATZ23717.1 Linear gramicidin dehydrogenase LgrE [Streptomyces lavendulae subsp. lavendulae]QUQ53549.1 Thioesterase PikA5 [Streptomyces lavendulae subsp. lavendulae]
MSTTDQDQADFTPAPDDVVWDLPGEGPQRTALLVLPHAGGNAHAYAEWRAHLPADVRLLIGQYPGRGARFAEDLPRDIADLAGPVVAALPDGVTEDLVVLGHSMGSLVAFEVVRSLEASGRPPRALVASACRAPFLANPCAVHPERLDDDELVAAIKERGGTDDGILDEPELREIILPSIRADFAIDDVYRCAESEARVACPVTVIGGDADPVAPAASLIRWAQITDRAFASYVLPGGHFYFQEQLPEFFSVLGPVVGGHAAAPAAA